MEIRQSPKLLSIRTRLFLVFAILLSSALGGLLAPVEATDRIPLKVQMVPFISWGPIMIAQEEGFFLEEGLDIELVKLPLGAAQIAALINGDVDVCADAPSASFVNAILKGQEIRIVADKGHTEKGRRGSGIVAGAALWNGASPFQAQALRNKTISLLTRLSTPEFFLETWLSREGINTNEITIVTLPLHALMGALQNESLQAGFAVEPMIAKIEAQKVGRLAVAYDDVLPNQQLACIFFGPRLLTRERETGRRFMKAYLRGCQTLAQGKTKRNVAILSKYTGLSEKILSTVPWEPVIHEDGHIEKASLVSLFQWYFKKQAINRVPSIQEVVDETFLKPATDKK